MKKCSCVHSYTAGGSILCDPSKKAHAKAGAFLLATGAFPWENPGCLHIRDFVRDHNSPLPSQKGSGLFQLMDP